ncbi:MAG TPA: hypothetical protein VNT26_13680 [Candidatus Sulfotelmatobacter sp.]|nr:hypothetical protein [Candidatus Sulfotelmatobacter sp.]HWI56039.1 hypothetical protein [Bacillota bacterium]
MKRVAGLLLLALLLTGCVTGAHLVTGKARASFAPDAVRIYQAIPPNAEVIGTVIAQSIGNDQRAMDRGVTELKRQAAQIGANGLVIGIPAQTAGGFLVSPTIQLNARAFHLP